MKDARGKGITFERDIAAAFEQAGFVVRGLEAGGDYIVISPDGSIMHGEAKRQERLQLPMWLRQQERDCPGGVRRFLVFKQSRQMVYVVEPFGQFLERERLIVELRLDLDAAERCHRAPEGS